MVNYDGYSDLLALMLIESRGFESRGFFGKKSEDDNLQLCFYGSKDSEANKLPTVEAEITSTTPTVVEEEFPSSLKAGESLQCGLGLGEHSKYGTIDLSIKLIRRWKAALAALERIENPLKPGLLHEKEWIGEFHWTLSLGASNFLRNMTGYLIYIAEDFFSSDLFAMLLAMLIFLSIIYGGIHLSAWKWEFPSSAESIIWKVACFDIIGSPVVFIIGALTPVISDTDILAVPLGILMGIVYGFSRVYIVAEAFISLRHVPIGVYSTVPWIQAIPHV